MCLCQGLDAELLNFVTVYLLSTLNKTHPANVFKTSTCFISVVLVIAVSITVQQPFPPLLFYGISFISATGAYHEKGYHSGTENINHLFF